MNHIFRRLLVVCVLVLPFIANGQRYFQKAEKQFELKAYDLAVANYKMALESKEDCIDCVYKIGESYRLQNKSLEAAIWYRKIADKQDLPKDFHVNYGLVMKKMGQFDKAQDHFVKYQLVDPIVGQHYALSCDFAKMELGQPHQYELALYKGSSRDSDYGSVFHNGKVVFSSFRKDMLRELAKNEGSSLNPLGPQLFTASAGTEADLDNLEFLRADADETFDVTNVSYASSGNYCAFTKSNYARTGMEIIGDDDDMHIYFAKVDNGGNFYEEIAFDYNEVGYATGFPSLSFDGKAMYFSSNRPGGSGGYDIYVSYFKGGTWSYPENLGANVNTPGNEITPFLDNNKLYFASDYHHGLGGFDIFNSTVQAGDWSVPSNIGNGVNSPEDDFYPSVQPGTDVFYFTSNRIGGRGNHDIYIGTPIRSEEIIASIPQSEPMPTAVALDEDRTPVATTVSNTTQSAAKVVTTVKEEVAKSAAPIASPTTTTTVSTQRSDVPPPAVNLDDLERKAKVGTVSMADAKKVSYGSIVNTSSKVYFIQLAALYHSVGNLMPYKGLISYGNIYKLRRSNVTKIKLGYFLDEYEAKRVLADVKTQGYTDAFITQDPLNEGDMELLISKDDTNVSFGDEFSGGYTSGKQYKVRLAAYEDAVWFEVNKVKDLGVIEQWSKKDWTIFVLSGYRSFEEAEAARISANNRGFADAAVVIDRDGVLETIKSH